MARFFVNRPIVAIVIAIVMVIVGAVNEESRHDPLPRLFLSGWG